MLSIGPDDDAVHLDGGVLVVDDGLGHGSDLLGRSVAGAPPDGAGVRPVGHRRSGVLVDKQGTLSAGLGHRHTMSPVGDSTGWRTRMNFAFSEEQDELRKSVRRFLDDKSPETEVRRLMETTEGYDPAVWTQMAEQLGLQSLIIPEEYGGSGFTYVELIVVLEEMGAALLCAPFFSTVALAANALLTSGDQKAMEYLLPGHRRRRDHRHPGLHRGHRAAGTPTASPWPPRPPATAGRSTATSPS